MWPPAGHLPSLSLFPGVDRYNSTDTTRLSHGPTGPAKAGSPGRRGQSIRVPAHLNPTLVSGLLGGKPYAQSATTISHHPCTRRQSREGSLSPFHRWGN